MSSLPPYAQATEKMLNDYVGKHISSICGNGYDDDSHNHCAHFVSHVLNLTFGYTCKQQSGGSHAGANIRVHELFARCGMVGLWSDLPVPLIYCLAFVTDQSNVNLKDKIMQNVPKKHVGIYYFGTIYQYKNALKKVISQTPAEFQKHYLGAGIRMYFGTIPS